MSENVLRGNLLASNLKVAIVASRFNELITKELIYGAKDALTQLEISESNITLAWVPGAYEISLIAQELANTKRFDAIICLGAVIKGSTPHFDYVAGEVSKGIANASLKTGVPIIFGVLTTNTIEQAIERAGTKAGNKGREAAYAAVEMASLLKKIHTL